MDSSAAKVGAGGIDPRFSLNVKSKTTYHKESPSCGFAIALILGIGGLIVGAVGASGYFHVGALKTMAQVNAIIMMAAGGGVGMIFLILAVKKRPQIKECNQMDARVWGLVFNNPNNTRSLYGSEAWETWNVEILDNVPEPPQGDPTKVNLYIPKRVKANGQERDFDLNVLSEVSGSKFVTIWGQKDRIEQQLGASTGSGRWIQIDMNMDRTTLHETEEAQNEIMKQRGGRMPSVLEAILLIKLVAAHTGKPLWGENIFTRCRDKVDGASIYVGFGYEPSGVHVGYGFFEDGRRALGAACVQN